MLVTEQGRGEFFIDFNLQEQKELKELCSTEDPSKAHALQKLILQGLLPSRKCKACDDYGT